MVDELVTSKCNALMQGYHLRWHDNADNCEVLEVERLCTSDLVNPDTQAKSRTFRVAGKLDLLLHRDGKRVLVDHKTSSDDIVDPAGTYWRILVVEAQPSHYCLLKWLNGEKVDEIVWDVIRRPTISPKQLKSKAERASCVATRRYCDQPLSDASLAWLAENDRENVEMYEARLTADCTRERPEWYYQRRTIPRLDSELLEYAAELWTAGQMIIEARRLNRWQKHPGSCMSYGRPCEFLGICSNFDRADSDKWQKKPCVHTELEELNSDGRDTLTYSSVRTFQACPKRYYYRYELGITRTDEGDSEALNFGRDIHLHLAEYWQSLMPVENANGDSNDPANSVGCGSAEEVCSW